LIASLGKAMGYSIRSSLLNPPRAITEEEATLQGYVVIFHAAQKP
jgi:hypothetical protein